MIGDSRLRNLHRLREGGVTAPLMLLRVPALSAAAEVVACADVSLNSELAVLEALSAAALAQGRVHEVIVMVDLGDLREGVMPTELVPLVTALKALAGVRMVGLGTNLACFGGVVPSRENMGQLVALSDEAARAYGQPLRWVSGLNSSGLALLEAGHLPPAMNQARIGEAILLGRETIIRRPWPGTAQDAFLLHAEVLELKRKPSVPIGTLGEDAFGERPRFAERGERLRALLNVGREDVEHAGLTPLDERLSIVGASSGYLVMDVSAAAGDIRVGDVLPFALTYGALLRAMTSEYVEKRLLPLSAGDGVDTRGAP
jgi:predicted amino acid racemase